MATLRFVIRTNKSAVNKDGTTTIFLRYSHGKQTFFSTKKRIPVDAWNQQNQQAKRSYKGHSTLKILLSKFKQEIEDIVNKAIYEGIDPTVDYVREQYNLKIEGKTNKQKKKKSLSFDEFVEIFIEESKRTKKKPTIIGYGDLVRILNIYKKSRRIRTLNWDSFTMDWYYDFMDFYIHERGANNNTFGKMIKTLKTFLNAATQQGYNTNLEFKDKRFKVYQEEVSHIYLNEEDIKRILDLDL